MQEEFLQKNLLEQEIALAQLKIGADSGGHVYLGYGHRPDMVVGDLDSFVYTRHKGINLLELPDQETNDLEKSLEYALEKASKQCAFLGLRVNDLIIVLKTFLYSFVT